MKINKWWIFGLAAAAAIAVAIFLAESFLKKRIKEELQIQTVHGDTLQINTVNLGLLRGWVDINDLVIRWNIAHQDTVQQNLTYLVKGKVGKIQLKGLSYARYLFNNEIHLDQILIDSSALDFHLLESPTGRQKASQDSGSLSEQDLLVRVDGVKIAPSRIRYFAMGEDQARFEADAISLNIEEFNFPQRSDSGKYLRHFDWEARDVRYRSPDTYSDLLLARSAGNSRDSSFTFSDFRFLPRYSKKSYSQHLKHKDSRVDIAVHRGRVSGLSWPDLLTNGAVRARTCSLDSFRIEVYEDSRLPVDPSRYKSLYQEKLLGAQLGITVDTTRFAGGTLVYEIRPEGPQAETGFLKFLNLNAILTNITNEHDRIAEQALLRAEIHTRVNGASELDAYFTFDLTDPDYAYSYAGDMHGFHLPQFNTILMETSQMKIAEGEMQRLSYRVDANKYLAQGEMEIDYRDLKIEWLEQHNKLAALAQKVVMREQNPKNGNYRIGQIYHRREPHRSFWNGYLKSLLSGLKSTAMPNLFLPDELDAKKENREKK